MQLPLQITFRGLPGSPALEAKVRASAQKLERFYGRITRCHVAVEATSRDHQTGHQFQVHIDLTVPGAEIVARRNASAGGNENVYVAVRDAFAAVTRQLEDHVRKQRGDTKRHEAALPRARF
jgi:ribosomal subunit interface protein